MCTARVIIGVITLIKRPAGSSPVLIARSHEETGANVRLSHQYSIILQTKENPLRGESRVGFVAILLFLTAGE